MKLGLTLATFLFVAGAVAPVHAANFFQLTFDENCTGSYITTDANNPGPTTASCSDSAADDPTGAFTGAAVIYQLPYTVISGDVVVLDTDGSASDLLRFTNANGVLDGGLNATEMIFYSFDCNGDAADTCGAIPADANPLARVSEDANGNFDWQPGGAAYPANNEYLGVSSEETPEPATLSTLLIGFGGIGLAAFRRRKRA
jgi:hypothetical protein